MSSLAETRNMKLGFRPFRVMPVAAAHGPTYGTFSSWNTGSMARPTGEWIPPNTTTAFSRSITSRAAVTPFPGLPSSSRMTSSIFRPPSRPPLALISSMATVSPRLIASPESAEPPDMAATSATTTGGLVCCAGAVVAVSATASVRSSTVRENSERRIEPPELRLPHRWAVTSRPSGETVARRPKTGGGGLQKLLHDDRVDPAAIEQALLRVDSHRAKTVLAVQRHPALVGGERGEHQLVKAVLAAQLDEARQQRAAHALAAMTPLRVHGNIHHVAVGVARVEDVQTSPADDFAAFVLGHDDRVARALARHPGASLVGRAQLGLECRDPIFDPLVVDAADRVGVGGCGQPHRIAVHPSSQPKPPVTSVLMAANHITTRAAIIATAHVSERAVLSRGVADELAGDGVSRRRGARGAVDPRAHRAQARRGR